MKLKRIIVSLLTVLVTISGCTYHHEIVRLPDAPLYNQTVIFDNIQYIPILRFCDYYNLEWSWDLVSQRIEIKKGSNTIALRPDSSLALINDNPVELIAPVEYKNGTAYIPAESAFYISKEIFNIRAEERVIPVKEWYRMETVVIDPGHGGKDPGAISKYGTKEKDIVLDVAKRLRKRLENEGLDVVMTRDRDVFVPLAKRAAIAGSKKADLFISIHANASRYSRAKGFEVYYLSEATDDNARAMEAAENAVLKFEEGESFKDETELSGNPTVWDLKLTESRRQSRELAYYICNIGSDSLKMKKRGVKSARFMVLKGTTMPAVLVEVGFLTNRSEESQLKRSAFREEIADAIATSILAYKKEYERTRGFTD